MADKRKVVIDCDTGVDDAVAILLCLQHFDVLGITTVGGNVGLANTQKNTRYVVETAGRYDVPVFAGYAQPMLVPLRDASYVHGKGGLGPIDVPEPTVPLQEKHAVDFLVETFMNVDDVTLITLGPLTNVAMALRKEPRLKDRISQIVTMGGSTTFGNATPAAEFNIYVDPEAAKVVFEAGIPLKMMGLNTCRQQTVSNETTQVVKAVGNPVSDLVSLLCEDRVGKLGRNTLCDACAVAWLIDPAVVTKSVMMHVVVETRGEFTRGMTLCDTRTLWNSAPERDLAHERTCDPTPPGKEPNVDVAMEISQERFTRLLVDTMKMYS